ncbi:glutathione S-transferase family protein [Nitrosovibrio sp. Nv4]|uniref:glutathione S-transferase family protein n=1 Tax=Nitrosovibrio sp. Nv4 TaxID=1945880 RepID=UPI000BDD4622|nr:glutathione S-transferase family protein [Nitrosovibrio sp. Nv4]SOD41109.1 Glutathione S-transferase [Nitrosovibrio sp. Nv4]
MLILYQFQRTWGNPNLSHFCCKTETYLRMAEIEYDIKTTLPLSAPKGKLPYIKDGDLKLADSRFIIRHLKTRYKDLDKGLNPSESALSLAMQRLIEEHLFWVTMYSRWQYTDANWQVNKKAVFGVLPPVIRDVAALVYRYRIGRQIYGHGIGRHKPEEIFELGMLDIDALSACLGDKKYFLGDQPTTLDASAFGFLINTIACPIESPVKDHGLSKSNLRNYVDRIKTEYYADLRQP